MALPFFSIDLNTSDIFNLIKNIFLPNNNEKSKNEILSILSKRFPAKAVCLLPSARLGFYLSLKNYFKENDEIIFSAMSFPLYVKIANQLKLLLLRKIAFPIYYDLSFFIVLINFNKNGDSFG